MVSERKENGQVGLADGDAVASALLAQPIVDALGAALRLDGLQVKRWVLMFISAPSQLAYQYKEVGSAAVGIHSEPRRRLRACRRGHAGHSRPAHSRGIAIGTFERVTRYRFIDRSDASVRLYWHRSFTHSYTPNNKLLQSTNTTINYILRRSLIYYGGLYD